MIFILIGGLAFFIGFFMFTIGNYILFAVYNIFGWSTATINDVTTATTVLGIFLMVLGFIIFIIGMKKTSNAENSRR